MIYVDSLPLSLSRSRSFFLSFPFFSLIFLYDPKFASLILSNVMLNKYILIVCSILNFRFRLLRNAHILTSYISRRNEEQILFLVPARTLLHPEHCAISWHLPCSSLSSDCSCATFVSTLQLELRFIPCHRTPFKVLVGHILMRYPITIIAL